MSEPVVRMSALRVQDDRGAVHGIDLALPTGPIGALIGSPFDGTTALALAIAGVLRPRGGLVTVAGQNPRKAPALRRRMGVLLDEPELPDVGRVRDLLAMVRKLRGGEAPREAWFGPLGFDALVQRRVSSLNRWEQRAVALGLALAVPSPTLLLLHDPLGEVAGISADLLRPLLQARAQAGACVLVLTPSTRDATVLADDVATLERGRIGRAMGQPDIEVLTPGSPVELQVWCDMSRSFASALLLAPEVTALTWSSSDGNSPLRVHGASVEGCARAVARVAMEQGVTVHAILPVVPSSPEVNAATAGLVLAVRQQAAYASSIGGNEGGQ